MSSLTVTMPSLTVITHSHHSQSSLTVIITHGNIEADRLAKEAQILAADLDNPNNICLIRDKIFNYSAALISNIDALIISNTVPCDGPSPDDFSLSDPIRNISRDVP